MNQTKAIALQGVGSKHPILAVQGFGQKFPVYSNQIRFAPYLYALLQEINLNAINYPLLVWVEIDKEQIIIFSQTKKDCFTNLTEISNIQALTSKNIYRHMTDFFIKKGDTLPRIESTLKYSVGQNVDLTGAQKVELIYRPIQGGSVVVKTGSILNALEGKVFYQWVAGDTMQAGDYHAEWRITFEGGGILTIPNNGNYIDIKIVNTLT